MTGMPMPFTTALFFVALLTPARVGLREVILNHVKLLHMRSGILAVIGFILTGLALCMLKILLLTQH